MVDTKSFLADDEIVESDVGTKFLTVLDVVAAPSGMLKHVIYITVCRKMTQNGDPMKILNRLYILYICNPFEYVFCRTVVEYEI